MSNGSSSPCPCGEFQDPEVVTNPPDLPQIAYRVDDFTGFRRALLQQLPGEQAIGAWRPAPGDLGLQVLEWWAYLADILTFYNERIANESYLRTAQLPASITNLVALLGYQAAPGLGATGQVAAVRTASHPAEPVTMPEGMRLSSQPTPGVPGQTFEVSATSTFSGPSNIPVTLPPDTSLVLHADGSPESVLLAGTVSGVKQGDRLLLVARDFAGDDDWALVTVASVTPAPDPATGTKNTLVTFTDSGDVTEGNGWGPYPAPSPPAHHPSPSPSPSPTYFPTPTTSFFPTAMFMARRTALARPAGGAAAPLKGPEEVLPTFILDFPTPAFFGSSYLLPGPTSPNPQTTDYRLLKWTQSATLWNQASSSETVVDAASGSTPFTVHLGASVRSISTGDTVLFDMGAGNASSLARVARTQEYVWAVPNPQSSAASADLLVSHTALGLDLGVPDGWALKDVTDPTAVTVRYGLKDVGTIIGVPDADLPSIPATVDVPTSYAPPALGAAAFLVDPTGAGVAVTVSPTGTDGQVTVSPTGTPPSSIPAGTPLAVPLQLLVDLAPVSRGTTVSNETLGDGNATLINQTFTLAKSPLTYFASGNGWTSTLSVFVNGLEWQEVPSMYGQPATARVFVVTRSPDQTVTTVRFGDGLNGARLPTGTGNVTATYRYGSGLASPPAGRLTSIVQPQPNLASIANPVAVSGGNDPQSPADVKKDAPASVFTFGRAISAIDYEVVAAQAPGVARVAAVWTWDGQQQRTLVTLYVGDDDDAVTAAAAALQGAEDPNRPVSVVAATPSELGIFATVVVAADRQVAPVLAAARAALFDPGAGLFSPSRMGIGQRLYRSAIDAALMVPGVVAVHGLQFGWMQNYDEVADPGEGSYFTCDPSNAANITGVNAGA